MKNKLLPITAVMICCGAIQTADTDYTWVPCEWNGNAEQNVVFGNGLFSGNTRVTGITVTYRTPGEGPVVSRPEIIPSETDNTVAMSCETDGAAIYYTLDGTDPSQEKGTLYESAITLTKACTVKAVAVLDGTSSVIASLDVYPRIVDSLEAFLSNASPETTKINCPVTAITKVGSYLMVKDDKGSFAMVQQFVECTSLGREAGIVAYSLIQ